MTTAEKSARLWVARAIWKSIPAEIGLPILDPIPKSIRLVVLACGNLNQINVATVWRLW